MRDSKHRRRKLFLAEMSKDAIASYDEPYKEWDEDEREYLPFFLSLVGKERQILDLAGGYAKAPPFLIRNGNSVVMGDLSLRSLQDGRKTLAPCDVQFVRLNMLIELPFADAAFDGIWFAEAFEYVPPDERMEFLRELRRIVKKGGAVFLNVEGLSSEVTWFTYLRNFLYWKLVRRAPVVWGEYIYMLDLPGYKGWHYHSLVLTRRIQESFRAAGFKVLRSECQRRNTYWAYLLEAV